MLSLLADTPENGTRKAQSVKDLEMFSKLGLRTLVLAYKDITDDEFADWYSRYEIAATAVSGREKLVRLSFYHYLILQIENVNVEMEKGFKLIGCTAIEDKLQDGVPEAIHFLLEVFFYIQPFTDE